MASAAQATDASVSLVSLGIDRTTWGLALEVNIWLLLMIAAIAGLSVLVFRKSHWRKVEALDLDETELGIGSARVKLKPNYTDRQVAYQIWVELSTRKIGLKVDLAHDVIIDIYDSWHAFFGVTRELIKTVPVNKVANASTKTIVDLSIDLLNLGLRPHLTQWQARYRTWFARQVETAGDDDPQTIQQRYPHYEELVADLYKVNDRLMAYRRAMYQVVNGSTAAAREAIEQASEVVGEQPSG
jgi:hypothetical protein